MEQKNFPYVFVEDLIDMFRHNIFKGIKQLVCAYMFFCVPAMFIFKVNIWPLANIIYPVFYRSLVRLIITPSQC